MLKSNQYTWSTSEVFIRKEFKGFQLTKKNKNPQTDEAIEPNTDTLTDSETTQLSEMKETEEKITAVYDSEFEDDDGTVYTPEEIKDFDCVGEHHIARKLVKSEAPSPSMVQPSSNEEDNYEDDIDVNLERVETKPNNANTTVNPEDRLVLSYEGPDLDRDRMLEIYGGKVTFHQAGYPDTRYICTTQPSFRCRFLVNPNPGIKYRDVAVNNLLDAVKLFISAATEVQRFHDNQTILICINENKMLYDPSTQRSYALGGSCATSKGRVLLYEYITGEASKKKFMIAPECRSIGTIANESIDVFGLGSMMIRKVMHLMTDENHTHLLFGLLMRCCVEEPKKRIELDELIATLLNCQKDLERLLPRENEDVQRPTNS